MTEPDIPEPPDPWHASVEPEAEAEARSSARAERAETIIRKHAVAALAVGFVPLPFIDLAALVGIQMNMIRAIGEVYDMAVTEKLGRSLLASLTGGIVPLSSASLIKTIPVVGQLLGGITAPALTGASTYAVGRVFVMHFESGGTFLSLDPDEVKAHYRREFERAQATLREQSLRDLKP